MIPRTYYFSLYWLLSLVLFRHDISGLINLSWNDNRHTHIILVPIICLGLIYLKRKSIFRNPQYGIWPSLPLLTLAVSSYGLAKTWPESLGEYGDLTLATAAIALTWIAGFVLFYGLRSAKAAVFPLTFLLLAIPIPSGIVAAAEVALQNASAEVTYILFNLLSIPVFREGLVFSLPGLTIEVAQECSGIRSTISLLIAALLLGHCFLRANWRRAVCVILAVPIAIFKNAVRITTLSWLGAYVSKDYLHGDLHHNGGPLFSMLSLALLMAVMWVLRKGDEDEPAVQPPAGPMVMPLMTGNKQKA